MRPTQCGVQNVLAETADSTREDYDRVMAINLRCTELLKSELQQMRKQGTRPSSIALAWGLSEVPSGIYHAAKARSTWFTRARLSICCTGIRINAVCPGLIHTPMSDQMIASGQADASRRWRRASRWAGWPPRGDCECCSVAL